MAQNLTETVWTRIDRDTKHALEVRAEQDDRSTASVIRAAIRSYLATKRKG